MICKAKESKDLGPTNLSNYIGCSCSPICHICRASLTIIVVSPPACCLLVWPAEGARVQLRQQCRDNLLIITHLHQFHSTLHIISTPF